MSNKLGWQDSARCKDMDPSIFFGDGPAMTTDDVEYAKGVCAVCSVRPDCLEFALSTNQEFGIWAGLSEGERKKLRRQRRLATSRSDRTQQRSTEARRLTEMGNSAEQVARQMGVDRRTVQRLTRTPVAV